MTTGKSFGVLLAAAVSALALLAGCGGEESEPQDAGEASAAADDGCESSHPIRQHFADSAWDVLVHVCASGDGRELRAENVSSLVLVVRTSAGYPSLQIEPPAGRPSFAQETVLATVPSGCAESVCALLAGQVLLAYGESPFTIDFSIDGRLTFAANAAASLAAWIQQRLAPTLSLRNTAVACAQQTGALFAGAGTWDDALRTAMVGYPACNQLVRAVVAQPEPQAIEAAETVATIGRGLRGGTWIDGLLVTAARLVHR